MNQQEEIPSNYIMLGPVGTITAGFDSKRLWRVAGLCFGGSSTQAVAESESWPTAEEVATSSDHCVSQ